MSHKVSKRVFDIIVSIVIIILISPILLILSIWIKIEDKGPVLFKQKRAGINGETFLIYKFRSMRVKQNKISKEKSLCNNWVGGVPDDFIFKTTHNFNPNVTKVGRFIRKYSLDELPQFFNVLRGEMSIVGPRPEIIDITVCYNKYQKQRLNVKPGITGWAQINGRSEIPHGEKIEYDLFYVKNQNLILDLKIFFKTILQAILGRGAI
ncbi:glycosyl transferase [Cytobacillus firmus]|nr:glycosyl transferase [Cytobacillus firmus]